MATKNILETKLWKITGKHTVGKLEKKEVKLTIFKRKPDDTEEEVEKKTVPIQGDSFSHDHTSAKVPDDQPNTHLVGYSEFARYIGLKKRKSLPDNCFVWPAEYRITAKDESDQVVPAIGWSAKQGASELGPPPTDDKGEAVAMLLPNKDALKVVAKTPWTIVTNEPTDGKLRVRKLTVKRMIVPEFVNPVPREGGKSHRQYVNLVTADSGRDFLGSAVEIEAGVKDEGEGKGKANDVIYVEVRCGRESKRTPPANPLSGVDALAVKVADKVFTGNKKLAADEATVKFKVDLGLAGGDTCEVRLSGVKDVFDANCPVLKFVNWRRIFFQLSLPKGASAPNLARITTALSGVNVEYKRYKKIDFAKDSGPVGGSISWMPGEWLDDAQAGKKLLNLGDYNKDFFHGKFSDDKNPVGVHVACCHSQYDANSASCVRDFLNLPVAAAPEVGWKDGSTVAGLNIWVGGGLFPKFLKDGSTAFVSGSWAEVGGAGAGALSVADVWVRIGSNLGWLTVKLPVAAKTVVDSAPGKKVQITLQVQSALGPFLGEADNPKKWLQLIVVREGPNVVNDVLAHELGHTLNQVTTAVAPGLSAADHGRKYTGNGHQGGHCADGMSTANYAGGAGKAGTAYQGNFAGKPECTCIMYGENGAGSTCVGKFCARCTPFLKAEAMKSLH